MILLRGCGTLGFFGVDIPRVFGRSGSPIPYAASPTVRMPDLPSHSLC
jgi:hypothetical protein